MCFSYLLCGIVLYSIKIVVIKFIAPNIEEIPANNKKAVIKIVHTNNGSLSIVVPGVHISLNCLCSLCFMHVSQNIIIFVV